VSISGGEINGQVYGGYAHDDSNVFAEASGNLVLISGGVINGQIFGGYVDSGPDDQAVNNRVVITDSPDLHDSDLTGGFVNASGAAQFEDNTLVVATDSTLAIKSVSNVENFEFILPANAEKGYVALEAQNIAFGDPVSNAKSVITGVSFQSGGAALEPGDEFSLFKSDSPLEFDKLDMVQDQNGGIPLSGGKGISLLYDFSLDSSGVLTVTNVRSNPQVKALSESFLGSLALINQGADHVAGSGMEKAVKAAEGASGLAAFASISGGTSRYDTGSHVDVKGFSLLTGLSWGHDFTPGRLTLGAFFEYGSGDYDTSNSFSNAASVKGDGDADYTGGGILARFDFAGNESGNFYAEASGRMGGMNNDFDSSSLRDYQGRKAEYDSSSVYYGLHAGAGYIWQITDAASLDLYAKYLWTRQEGDSVTLSTGDPVRFEDADSHRARAGARFSYALNDVVKPYVGAAWEYEFDGEAGAATYGYSIKAADLKGGTGIGEVGLIIGKPDFPLSLDLGVQGYAGTREGVTGSLQLKFEF
jgi:outer membrane autotransporter protein